jgi:probable rRNA maturation factor
MKNKIKVEITYQNIKSKNIYVPFMKKAINEIIRFLLKNKIIVASIIGKKDVVDILVCNDKEMKKLNKKYRNINKPTNELSFSYINDDSNYIGDIVINWDEVIRDSDKTFIDRKKSLLNFLSHALLHVFGYTHETEKKEREMENLKNDIIKYIENNM